MGATASKIVAASDSIGDGTVSAWDTNKRKEMGLTHGPGRSAAEEACAVVACGWARDWAGDAGLRELG